MATLNKKVVAAMQAAGLSSTQVDAVRERLKPKPKAVRLKRAMIKRIEEVVAEAGAAVVTAKRVFSLGGWERRAVGTKEQLAAARAAKAAKRAQGAAQKST